MSLRFYHIKGPGPKFDGQEGAGLTGSEDAESRSVQSEEKSFQTYLDRVLRLIPGETFVLYAWGIGLPNGPFSENMKYTIVAILCVVVTIVLRARLLPEYSRPQLLVLAVTAVVCVCWIYMMGGYFFVPAPEGSEGWFGLGLAAIGILFPAVYKGEVLYEPPEN